MNTNFKNYIPTFLKKIEPKDRINYARIINEIALANRSNNTNYQNKDYKKAIIFKNKLSKNYDNNFRKILNLKPDVINKLGKKSYGFIKRNQRTANTNYNYNNQHKISLNKAQSPLNVANLVNHYSIGRWADRKRKKSLADTSMNASVNDWNRLSPKDKDFTRSLNLQKLSKTSLYKLHLQASHIQKQNNQIKHNKNINVTKQSYGRAQTTRINTAKTKVHPKYKKLSNKLNWKQKQALKFKKILSKVPDNDKFSFSNYIVHRSTAQYYNKKNPTRSKSLINSAKKDLNRIDKKYQSAVKSTINNLSYSNLNSLGFNAREYNNKKWKEIKQNRNLHLPKVILKAHDPRFMRAFMANRINQIKLNPSNEAEKMAKKRLGHATKISYIKLDNYDKQLYKDNKQAIDSIGKSDTKFHKTLSVLDKMYNMTPDEINKAQRTFKRNEYQSHRHIGVNMTYNFLKNIPSNHKHQKGFQSAVKESNVPNYHSEHKSKKLSQKQGLTNKQKLIAQKKQDFQR